MPKAASAAFAVKGTNVIAQASNSNIGLLISLLLMVAIFYFLLIRPQQRRMRQQRSLIESLDVGDEILTIGGMFATIRSVDDDSVDVEVAPGTTIKLVKSAVARKIEPEMDLEDEDEEADEAP